MQPKSITLYSPYSLKHIISTSIHYPYPLLGISIIITYLAATFATACKANALIDDQMAYLNS